MGAILGRGKTRQEGRRVDRHPGNRQDERGLALAADFHWDVVEMNASDQRNADAIKAIALRGAMETFSDTGEYLSSKDGKLKLIVLDEADNISGREDRGGVPAIAELVRSTKQPVILIVNDWYALSKKSSVLKNGTLQVKFSKIKTPTVRSVLRRIAADQGVKVSDGALEVLAENSNGDLRSRHTRPSSPVCREDRRWTRTASAPHGLSRDRTDHVLGNGRHLQAQGSWSGAGHAQGGG